MLRRPTALCRNAVITRRRQLTDGTSRTIVVKFCCLRRYAPVVSGLGVREDLCRVDPCVLTCTPKWEMLDFFYKLSPSSKTVRPRLFKCTDLHDNVRCAYLLLRQSHAKIFQAMNPTQQSRQTNLIQPAARPDSAS